MSGAQNQNTLELIYQGPADESPDTLRKLKAAFLVDLNLEVDKIQEILANAPLTVMRSEDEHALTVYYNAIKSAGGKVLLVRPGESKPASSGESKGVSADAVISTGTKEDDSNEVEFDIGIEPVTSPPASSETNVHESPISEQAPEQGSEGEEQIFAFDDSLTIVNDAEPPKEPKTYELPIEDDSSTGGLSLDEDSPILPAELLKRQTSNLAEDHSTVSDPLSLGLEGAIEKHSEASNSSSQSNEVAIDTPQHSEFDLTLNEEESVTPEEQSVLAHLLEDFKEDAPNPAPVEEAEDHYDLTLGEEPDLEDKTRKVKAPVDEPKVTLTPEAPPKVEVSEKKTVVALHTEEVEKPKPTVKEPPKSAPPVEAAPAAPAEEVTPPAPKQPSNEETEAIEEAEEARRTASLESKNRARAHARHSGFIGPLLIGIALLGAANWYYFSSDEKPLNPEQIDKILPKPPAPVKKVAPPTESEKPIQKVQSVVMASMDFGNKKFDAELSKNPDGSLSVSFRGETPRPPELTAEQIAARELQEPWIRKIEFDKTKVTLSADGTFNGLGTGRVYVDDQGSGNRIIANVNITGTLATASNPGKMNIKVQYGDSSPEKGKLIARTGEATYTIRIEAELVHDLH